MRSCWTSAFTECIEIESDKPNPNNYILTFNDRTEVVTTGQRHGRDRPAVALLTIT